jgi:tRNA threonylcarbamoyladenosine modification (KEOPS) complex  Pcc1 subunit
MELNLPNTQIAQIVAKALMPELVSTHVRRSTIALTRHASVLCLRILAKDPVALRASFNSIFKGIVLSAKLCEMFNN